MFQDFEISLVIVTYLGALIVLLLVSFLSGSTVRFFSSWFSLFEILLGGLIFS